MIRATTFQNSTATKDCWESISSLAASLRVNLAEIMPRMSLARSFASHDMKKISLAPSFRTIAIISLLLLVSAGRASAEEAHPTEPAYLYRAEVVRVVDGDTIDVDIDLGFYVWIRKQRIRLLDIDAPEVRGESKEAGLAASEYLKGLIDGKTVIIRTAKGKDGADRDDSFGRWLATIFLDGLDVNQEMMRTGHAVPYEGR